MRAWRGHPQHLVLLAEGGCAEPARCHPQSEAAGDTGASTGEDMSGCLDGKLPRVRRRTPPGAREAQSIAVAGRIATTMLTS